MWSSKGRLSLSVFPVTVNFYTYIYISNFHNIKTGHNIMDSQYLDEEQFLHYLLLLLSFIYVYNLFSHYTNWTQYNEQPVPWWGAVSSLPITTFEFHIEIINFPIIKIDHNIMDSQYLDEEQYLHYQLLLLSFIYI